ncbi:hypothetical protein PAHAL_4G009200 [Panicum hallii]|uniref:GDSL esterase/lipase n=1 Tax=Panicum hallii TaxID=206008 RepID=A0A2T8JBD8_9POAL|nr:hypothetical protein PAHAL_4G009200 [Panicum hallii]
MYVFGDSTLDVGNNNYLPGMNVPRANTPYYGVDFPGLSTGRFSNGLNTADFIAKMIGFVSSPPAYLNKLYLDTCFAGRQGEGGDRRGHNASRQGPGPQGWVVSAARTTGVSYASGGAGILDSTNAGNNIPLSKQVHYFNATRSKMAAVAGSGAVSAELSKSFFLVGIGGNDLSVFANAEQARNRSAAQQQSDTAAFYGSLISNYSATITNLYALGARKFAVINVGLAGCLPVARVLDAAGACSEDRNGLAAGFNDALRSLLADLAATLPGLVYSLADSLGLMVATFADPQASGFTDISDACCGSGRLGAEAECSPDAALCANRDQYYFWDRVHPTQRAAILRAQAFFYDGEAKYTTPINFKQLVHVTAA